MSTQFQQHPFDIVNFSEKLQRYITLKTTDNTLLQKYPDHFAKCKQFLFEANSTAQYLTALNQPKQHIPERIQHRFPFRYCRKLSMFLLRVFNFISTPQRTINQHLQNIAINSINASQQILLEQQQRQLDIQQKLMIIQQQLTGLANQLAELEYKTEHLKN